MKLEQRFKSSIKRGTGEVHLILRDNPNVDFSEHIIKASLTNHAYDGQVEGSRANYIFELIESSNQKEKIKEAILKGLENENKDTWALVQLFDLAALFAKQGDNHAYKAIYDRFYKNPIKNSKWVGQDVIIELDALDGLKYIAEVKGRIMKNKPEEWDDSFMVDYFQENNPSIKVYDELGKASESNPFIKIYLNKILEHKFNNFQEERPKYNYELVREKINNFEIVPLPPARAKDLSNNDIQKLADDFLKENNRNKQEKYMRIFDRVKFPYDYRSILNLAKSKYSDNDQLIEYSVNALRYFSGKDIREFAMEILQKTSHPEIYINLLISNYENGDSALLKGFVDSTKMKIKSIV